MSVYKTGRAIAMVSFVGLMASGFLYELALCLGFGVLMGAGFVMWVMGD